jgi:phosphohistidine phosphatase
VQLLVVRHGIAMEREESAARGLDDDLRPLTEEGRRKMAEGAKGLRELVATPDVLAASPLVRAQQTAAIVADAYGGLRLTSTSTLRPDSAPSEFLEWLTTQRGETVAVVGHEPHLGLLVTWLMTGASESRLPLKKGGACLLAFESAPRKDAAVLQWAMTSAQLRRMGR